MNAGVRKVSDRVGHMLEVTENIGSDIGPLDQSTRRYSWLTARCNAPS